jgi:hypothetical protein
MWRVREVERSPAFRLGRATAFGSAPHGLNFCPLLSIRVPMPATPSTQANDARVLAELRALREQLAALTSELRHRKQRAAKRVRSRRERLAREREREPLCRPTELDIARARRALR